jgi:hypothetical protein
MPQVLPGGFVFLVPFVVSIPARHTFQAQCFIKMGVEDFPIPEQQWTLDDLDPSHLLSTTLAFGHSELDVKGCSKRNVVVGNPRLYSAVGRRGRRRPFFRAYFLRFAT